MIVLSGRTSSLDLANKIVREAQFEGFLASMIEKDGGTKVTILTPSGSINEFLIKIAIRCGKILSAIKVEDLEEQDLLKFLKINTEE